MTINEQVLELDLDNLTEDQKNWLHDLKNKIQNINNAMYMKEQGKTGWGRA